MNHAATAAGREIPHLPESPSFARSPPPAAPAGAPAGEASRDYPPPETSDRYPFISSRDFLIRQRTRARMGLSEHHSFATFLAP